MSNEIMSYTNLNANSIYFDAKTFVHTQRIAMLLSESNAIPSHYRKNVANCFIAVATAMRMGLDPVLYMQKSSIINDRPVVEAQLLVAALNQSGLIKGRIEYTYTGTGDNRSCTAAVIDAETGKKHVYVLSLKDALRVGNASRNVNWRAIPDLMLAYRAATYLIRVYYPEAGMGLSTKDEMEDITIIKDISSETITKDEAPKASAIDILNAEFLNEEKVVNDDEEKQIINDIDIITSQ